jgi:tRNA(Arg) A34 adenosine deaminase TadA
MQFEENAALESDLKHLCETIRIARQSRERGSHPFGALLTDPDGNEILRAGNTYREDGGPGHAEANVARAAARRFKPDCLEKCTLFASVEPCCMCAGACYWTGIGTIVYGLSERRLAILTGSNPENLTLDLSCHIVAGAGQRKMTVRGPFPELENEIAEGHKDFW